jgi:hypothetical protein
MTELDDHKLLAEFARSASESAFDALVARHVNLVYSTALRFTGNPHHAQEITQAVFVILARKAGSLRRGTVLSGWLYQTARLTAANFVKGETRRQRREQEAYMLSTLNESDPAAWQQIAALLDDAMGDLGETDRNAVVLRFFENKTAQEVGAALNLTEAAAHKRVSRALEKLRLYLSKRGIALPAAALTAAISANAVQAAPVGLAITISTAAALAGTTLATATTATAIKTIAMTTLQKTVITATLAIVAGVGIYEVHQNSQLREQNQTLQQQQAPLAEQIQQWQRGYEDATNRLAVFRNDNDRLNSNSLELLRLRGEVTRLRNEVREKSSATNAYGDNVESAAKDLLVRVNSIKQQIEKYPERKIPEMQFLSPTDWLKIAIDDPNAEKNAGSSTLFTARKLAKDRFAPIMADALRSYTNSNAGRMPDSLVQLKPYFNSPVEDSLLQRYQLMSSNDPDQPAWGGMLIKEKAIVDERQDSLYLIGTERYSVKMSLGTNLMLPTDNVLPNRHGTPQPFE